MFEYMTIRELYELTLDRDELERENLDYIELQGWVRTNINNGSSGVIELNDGTYFRNARLVYNEEGFDKYSKYSVGCAITVMGEFVLTLDNKHPFEIKVKEIVLEGDCDEDYPLQKKEQGFEFIRGIENLRARENTFNAVFRVRSVLAMAVHEFFQSQGFVYVNSPIGICNDMDNKYSEAFALAFRDVYAFGPVNGKENDFWKIQPEIAFADLEDDMLLAEDMIKFCVNYVLENCSEEMSFFNSKIDNTLIERLTKVLNCSFSKMSYTDAIDILLDAKNDGYEFENSDIYWGMELQTEHTRYVSEMVINGPLFLTDCPKDIKKFYVRLNDDGRTVASCDLIVPFVGELIEGSQKEERYDCLVKRMNELDVSSEGLDWYLDLRRYGGCNHAGFGVSFDRLVMYVTGMQDIRDVIPFAKTPKN